MDFWATHSRLTPVIEVARTFKLPFRTSGEGYRVNAVGPSLQPGGPLVVTAP